MVIKNLFVRYQFFWRLLLTLSLCFYLPIIIVNWYTVDTSYNASRQANYDLQKEKANSFMELFQDQMKDMVACRIKMTNEQLVTSEMIDEYSFYPIGAIEEMEILQKDVRLASNLYLWFKNKDYVVGSTYIYQKELFGNSFSTGNAEFQSLIEEKADALENSTEFLPIPSPRNSLCNGVLIMMPCSIGINTDMVLMFHINSRSLRDEFFGKLRMDSSELYVYNNTGELLLSDQNTPNAVIHQGELTDFLLDITRNRLDIRLDGETWCITRVYDSQLCLSFVVAISESALMHSADSTYSLLRTVMLLTIVLMAIMIAFGVYINYRPISIMIRKLFGRNADRPPGNELEGMMNVVNETMDIMEERTSRLSYYILRNLFDGGKVRSEELKLLDLHKDDKHFCVISFSEVTLDEKRFLPIKERACYELGCTVHVAQEFYDKRLSFLCLFPKGDDGVLEELAQMIRGSLREANGNKSLRTGIGVISEDISRVHDSYLTSLVALDQCNYGCILYYDDVVTDCSGTDCYPTQSVLQFVQLLKHGNREAAESKFDDLANNIKANVSSQMLKKYVCYDIINLFFKSAQRMNIPVPDIEREHLMRFHDINELIVEMRKMIKCICAQIDRKRQSSERSLIDSIVKYIDQNISNPDLSRSVIADHFGLSMGNLSGIINNAFGRSLREYIVEKRVELSKVLLTSTFKSIGEISLMSGFRDPSYFIRVFKKYSQSTPQAYRLKYTIKPIRE